MREEYDFSNFIKNPYAKHVKKQIIDQHDDLLVSAETRMQKLI